MPRRAVGVPLPHRSRHPNCGGFRHACSKNWRLTPLVCGLCVDEPKRSATRNVRFRWLASGHPSIVRAPCLGDNRERNCQHGPKQARTAADRRLRVKTVRVNQHLARVARPGRVARPSFVFKWGGCRSLTGLALDDLEPGGFQLAEEASFLRKPNDTLEWRDWLPPRRERRGRSDWFVSVRRRSSQRRFSEIDADERRGTSDRSCSSSKFKRS